ncbi:MAG: lipopolysaccharide heptosyltransferase I [Burkholderiales bacterium]
MLRILLVKTSSLGDVVHNFPAVTDIRRQLPNARIEWVVEEAYAPLVALHPAVDEVIPIAIRRWRRAMTQRSTWREFADLRQRLGNRPYDRVIDTQGLVKSAWIARLAKGEHIGLSQQTAREPMAARFYETTFHVPENRHAVERNRMMIALALNLKIHTAIDYGLSDVRGRSDAGSSRPYAVLLHGTARAEKEWPEGTWQELGRYIEGRGLQVVLPWGSEREEARSKRLAESMTSATVPPRLSIDDVARTLAAARLVVGVDTGLLHLGAALGVPTVAIFRGSDPALTGPVGTGRIVICGSKGHAPSLEEVIGAVGKMLDQ